MERNFCSETTSLFKSLGCARGVTPGAFVQMISELASCPFWLKLIQSILIQNKEYRYRPAMKRMMMQMVLCPTVSTQGIT